MSELRVPLAELAGLHVPKPKPAPTRRSLEDVVCPSGKMAYTKAEAKMALTAINQRHYDGKQRMRVYRCAFCPYYHIGHHRTGQA